MPPEQVDIPGIFGKRRFISATIVGGAFLSNRLGRGRRRNAICMQGESLEPAPTSGRYSQMPLPACHSSGLSSIPLRLSTTIEDLHAHYASPPIRPKPPQTDTYIPGTPRIAVSIRRRYSIYLSSWMYASLAALFWAYLNPRALRPHRDLASLFV